MGISYKEDYAMTKASTVTAIRPSNNPGMSDKAWKEWHQKLLKYNMKYKNEIQLNRMKGDEKIG